VSRRAKMAQPFTVAAKTFGSASANLARRAMRRELAYPGLSELVRQFYSAVRGGRPSPLLPANVADVACARDQILALMSSASAD